MNPWEGLGYLLHRDLERYKKNPDPRRLAGDCRRISDRGMNNLPDTGDPRGPKAKP
jgi:hypothetical protein